jgi:hypothetical protein
VKLLNLFRSQMLTKFLLEQTNKREVNHGFFIRVSVSDNKKGEEEKTK